MASGDVVHGRVNVNFEGHGRPLLRLLKVLSLLSFGVFGVI